MKIQTFSIILGNKSCNAHCPYCVAKMTPAYGIGSKKPKINWRNFDIGCKFAKDDGVSTVLMTGKGEPTLFPKQITHYLNHLKPYDFPFIELQTNGILFFQKKGEYTKYLNKWYKLGITIIAISVVHYDNKRNKEIFQPNGMYMDLVELIKNLHSIGFSIRLSCIMLKGFIDKIEEVKKIVEFARNNKVEQLTITPAEKPKKNENQKISDWVSKHKLEENQLNIIRGFLEKQGIELMRLAHGAVVYDLNGQNICSTNCLTIDSGSKDVRQLIFFPDGHLRYDWQYKGAILL